MSVETDIRLEDGAEVLVRVTEPDFPTDDATVIVVFPSGAYELAWRDARAVAEALTRAADHASLYD